MTEPAEVAIQSALITRLRALTLVPPLPLALPEVSFTIPTPSVGVGWLKADFMAAPTTGISIDFGAMNQFQGILQLTVFWVRGEGEYKAKRIASAVIEWFKRGTRVSKDGFIVMITKPPYLGSARADVSGGWLMIPVSVPYLAFAPDPD